MNEQKVTALQWPARLTMRNAEHPGLNPYDPEKVKREREREGVRVARRSSLVIGLSDLDKV